MALHPRMTRPGLRITIEALEAYKLQKSDETRQIIDDLLRELRYQLDTANADNRRRAAAASADKQIQSGATSAPAPADNRNKE